MANHTPGPWIVGDWTNESDDGKEGGTIESRYGGIARIIGWDNQDEETIPNARLIAAAPELYTAGKEVIAAWEKGDLAAAVRSLSKAIAKAEGIF